MLLATQEYEALFFPLAKSFQNFQTTQTSEDLARLIEKLISHIALCLFTEYYHYSLQECREIEDFLFQEHQIDLNFQIRLTTLLVATHPIHEPYLHPDLKLLEMTFWEEVEQMRQFYPIATRGSYLISVQELKKCQKLVRLSIDRFRSFLEQPILLVEENKSFLLNGICPQETKASTTLAPGIYFQQSEEKWVSLSPGYKESPAPEFQVFSFFQDPSWKKGVRFQKSFERYQRESKGKLDFTPIFKQHPHYVMSYRYQTPLKTFLKKAEQRMVCLGEPGVGKTALLVHLEPICKLKNHIVVKYFVQYQTLLQSSSIFIRYFYEVLSNHFAFRWKLPKEDAELLDFFQEMLKFLNEQGKPILLVIDNIDDAMTPFFPGEESLFELISREFPPNFKIILSARSSFFGMPYLADRWLEILPFSLMEGQRFLKELGLKKAHSEEILAQALGNPLILLEMQNWEQWKLEALPSLQSYFRKLFIRYSTANNLKLFLALLEKPEENSFQQLVQSLGRLSPLILKELEKIKPLVQKKENHLQFFHPLFYQYLKRLLTNLPFPKKGD